MSNRYAITGITPASIISAFMEDPFFGFDSGVIPPSKVSNSICSAAYPKSDIYTTEDGTMHIECACSGFSEDEISADYKDNYITVSLKKAPLKEKRCYLQAGIKYSENAKISFYIDPTYYDADAATAEFKSNGLFCITVPRSERLAKNRSLFGNKKVEIEPTAEITLEKKEEEKTAE